MVEESDVVDDMRKRAGAGERLAHAYYRIAELYETWNYAKTPAEALQALADMQKGIAELSDAIAQASRETPDRYFGPSRIRRRRVVHPPQRRPGAQRVRGHVRRR